MRRVSRIFLLSAVFVAACGSDPVSTTDPAQSSSGNEPISSSGGEDPGGDPASSSGSSGKPKNPNNPDDPNDTSGIVIDMRADTNRDGTISFDGTADDDGEDVWDAKHGAVFLANIDDDEEACDSNKDDIDLPKCNDAADEVVNGTDDALDLARIKTKPFANAPAGSSATISWTNGDRVRLFQVKGTQYNVVESGMKIAIDDLKAGVELAIEGKDIVRDKALWDGYVDVTYTINSGGQTRTDKVRMRIAPLLTSHHLSPGESTWVSSFNNAGNQAMRADLATALAAAGRPAYQGINTTDSWAQDYWETGFMSMPGPNGEQHAIRVGIRSANEQGSSAANPLRRAGRVVFQLRGKDFAGIQEYDKTRNGKFDTLNSFGNFETIPPYTNGTDSYPLGRVIRGQTATYYPDKVFQKMIESQLIQAPLYIDTSWLLVGHVDETLSFIKASSPRGWVLLVNDAAMAKQMLQAQVDAGRGSLPMHVGKFWSNNQSAQVTISQVLSDTDVMSTSAEAVTEVNGQLAVIKQATGLTDAEIIHIPYLHMTISGASIAYQPGMVNGIYISDTHFVAPDPHGPVVAGQDIFKQAMVNALAPFNVTVHFAEDWDTYHRQMGEVHCGTNTIRQVPTAKWWESGR